MTKCGSDPQDRPLLFCTPTEGENQASCSMPWLLDKLEEQLA